MNESSTHSPGDILILILTNSSWSLLDISHFLHQQVKLGLGSLRERESEDCFEGVSVHLTWLSKLLHDSSVVVQHNLEHNMVQQSMIQLFTSFVRKAVFLAM